MCRLFLVLGGLLVALPAWAQGSPGATQNYYPGPGAAASAGGGAPSGPAGGDLSGTYPNPTVAKVSGTASSYILAVTAASAGGTFGGVGQ